MEIVSANNNHLIESVFLLRQCSDYLQEQHIAQLKNHYTDILAVKNDINNESVFVARVKNVTVGTITVNQTKIKEYEHISWKTKSDKILIINNFAVYPTWQKQGIGKLLMDYIENYAIKKGYDAIRLHLHESNYRTIKFFNAREYSSSGEFVSDTNKHKYICYEKSLSKELAV